MIICCRCDRVFTDEHAQKTHKCGYLEEGDTPPFETAEESRDRLLKENSILRQCVDFYEDINNWDASHCNDDVDQFGVSGISYLIGGKRARKCLKDIKNL